MEQLTPPVIKATSAYMKFPLNIKSGRINKNKHHFSAYYDSGRVVLFCARKMQRTIRSAEHISNDNRRDDYFGLGFASGILVAHAGRCMYFVGYAAY